MSAYADNLIESLRNSVSAHYPDAIRIDGRRFSGGFFCVAIDDVMYDPIAILNPYANPEYVDRWMRNSRSKVQTLLDEPDLTTSWERRNHELLKYGGGVRFLNIRAAFSGCSEHLDEALVAVAFIERIPHFTDVQWKQVVNISQNPNMRELGQILPALAA